MQLEHEPAFCFAFHAFHSCMKVHIRNGSVLQSMLQNRTHDYVIFLEVRNLTWEIFRPWFHVWQLVQNAAVWSAPSAALSLTQTSGYYSLSQLSLPQGPAVTCTSGCCGLVRVTPKNLYQAHRSPGFHACQQVLQHSPAQLVPSPSFHTHGRYCSLLETDPTNPSSTCPEPLRSQVLITS